MSSHFAHRLGCCRTDHPAIGRRELLQVGSLSLLGTGLADLLRLEAQAQAQSTRSHARAKSVVFIFQSGGPSQHETFDPKPEAPEMIRGDYGVTQTKLAGINFCEHLPKLSARADKFSIVRTMHHVAHPQFRNEHLSCMYLLHTGSTEMPAGDTNASINQPRDGRIEWPSFGSMVAYAAPTSARSDHTGLPAVIEIPRVNLMNYPGRGAGLLGPKYEHWKVDLAPVCNALTPPVRVRIVSVTMTRTIPHARRAKVRKRGGIIRAAVIRRSTCQTLEKGACPSRRSKTVRNC